MNSKRNSKNEKQGSRSPQKEWLCKMYVKLFSIKEVGETIDRFGYECEIAKIEYLFSVKQENIIGINESELKPKIKGCYRLGYVDIEDKCELLEANDATEISNAHIVNSYYEVFINEDARKLFPAVQRYYTDQDCYYKISKQI
jgi:hypothetical protein